MSILKETRERKISVRLTDAEYEALEQMALNRNIKISKLIQEMITENMEVTFGEDTLNIIEKRVQKVLDKELVAVRQKMDKEADRLAKLVIKDTIASATSKHLNALLIEQLISTQNRSESIQEYLHKAEKRAVEDVKRKFGSYLEEVAVDGRNSN